MNTGSVLAQFTITLSKAVSEPVAVEWFTTDGTAKAGVDYAANKGIAIFQPGQTERKVDILVYGRAVGSEDRTFFVEMLPPTNAILGASVGECIIHVDTTGSQPVTQVIVPTGPRGLEGKSAYQSWLDQGNTGSEADFLESLKPSAEDIAEDVAPLLDVGNAILTADGTSSLSKPDKTTLKGIARRVAYAAGAKIATVILSDGDNVVGLSDFSGDAIDLSSEGLCPRILRDGVFTSPAWSVQADGKMLIRQAMSGDVLYLCQYDMTSHKNENTNERELWRRAMAEANLNITAGSFEDGATVNKINDVVWHKAGAQCYLWSGNLPKSVTEKSSPGTSGGIGQGAWISVNETSIRTVLNQLLSFDKNNAHEKMRASYGNSNTIRISTWNIQTYAVVAARYKRNMMSPRRFHDLSRFIFKQSSEIVCMQEAYDGPSAHMSNLVVEPYVDSAFGFTTTATDVANMAVGYRAGNSTISTYDISDEKTMRITDEGAYIRLAARSVINHPVLGKIAIYNVHGSWFEVAAKQLYGQIIADYKALGVSKVIVTGDFNHDTAVTWFTPFTSDGFTIVNNLEYDTKNGGEGSWYIDNIIVKGFTVESVEITAPDPSLADHKMLTAVLKGA